MQLINETYAAGRLDFTQTRYFEAHSTGTPVGDPTKAGPIAGIFNAYRSRQEPLFIDTIKSNVGHLERTAGIAGLIKTTIVLKSGIISPRIWVEKPNPSIPLYESIHGLVPGFDERLLLLLVIEAATPMLLWRTHIATWRKEAIRIPLDCHETPANSSIFQYCQASN